MRIALLSDIHSNRQALSAVLADIRTQAPDLMLQLGDVVGYNADPQAVVEMLAEAGVRGVVGNHDLAVLGRLGLDSMSDHARRGVAWSAERLSPAALSWLASLPLTQVVPGVLMAVHAALHTVGVNRTTLRLVRDDARLATADALRRLGHGVPWCAYGHTHRPAMHVVEGVDVREVPVVGSTLPSGAIALINPGSVGLHRHGDWRATYLLLDSDRGRVQLRAVPYAARDAADAALAAGLAPKSWYLPPRLRANARGLRDRARALRDGLRAVG